MRLLLIDLTATSHSQHHQQMQAAYPSADITALRADALQDVDSQSFDGLVLAGDYQAGSVWERPYFLQAVELIRTTVRPLLGICLGFELICYAYGCQLHELAEQVDGAQTMTPASDGVKIFQGSDPIRLKPGRRWAVDDLPKELAVLARSETGAEAVRHKTRPQYGLQLRPEDFQYASDGKLVFANIFDSFARQRLVQR